MASTIKGIFGNYTELRRWALIITTFFLQNCQPESEQHDTDDESSSPESEVVNLDSPQPSTSSASITSLFEHSLKIVNPTRMSEFRRVNIHGRQHCSTLNEIKKLIADNFPISAGENVPDMDVVEMGYIEPGHGSKGKKLWLYTDADVAHMYNDHQGKTKKVLLWCYSHAKRSRKKDKPEAASLSGGKRSSKFEPQSEKMTEVDKIYSKLQEEHKKGYSPEQLRAWAHLLQMGKHDSYTDPLTNHFFGGESVLWQQVHWKAHQKPRNLQQVQLHQAAVCLCEVN